MLREVFNDDLDCHGYITFVRSDVYVRFLGSFVRRRYTSEVYIKKLVPRLAVKGVLVDLPLIVPARAAL
jgi:hypothetical protein